MADLYLNPLTNDLDLTNNRLSITNSIDELARQKLFITLSTFRGEYFANINFGIPYLANDHNNVQLLEKNAKELLDIELQSAILDTDGITSIAEYISTLNTNRELAVSFTAITETGQFSLSITI